MARASKNKIGLQFDGVEQMIKDLEAVQGNLKAVTEEALIESKKHVNEELKRVTVKENYPAGGKYSRKTNNTASSIDTDMTVQWEGMTASIKVGYDMKVSGLASIFLLYGTPRHKPPMKAVKKMYNAIFGAKMRKEVGEIQRKVFENAIKKGR